MDAALDRLPTGASLTFITENEPRGLSMGVALQRVGGFVIDSRRVARKVWRVCLTPRAVDGKPNALATQLASCAAFNGLDDRSIEEIAGESIALTGRRGETLVDENAEWPFVGMVTEGIVARAKGGAEDERERILYAVFPNELFGISEYFDRGLVNARIVAFSKTARVVKIPWSVLDAVAERHPRLTNALGVILAQRIRQLNDTLSLQGSRPIIARIAGVLLPYAVPGRELVPAVTTLGSITQSQIAAAAGTVKEVAARAIAELETRGALRRERGHIRYLDRNRLLDIIREPA